MPSPLRPKIDVATAAGGSRSGVTHGGSRSGVTHGGECAGRRRTNVQPPKTEGRCSNRGRWQQIGSHVRWRVRRRRRTTAQPPAPKIDVATAAGGSRSVATYGEECAAGAGRMPSPLRPKRDVATAAGGSRSGVTHGDECVAGARRLPSPRRRR